MIQPAKQMAAAIKHPSDLWELEHHLTERRKEIDHSVQTTERYLGCKQNLGNPANDRFAPIANTPNSLANAVRRRTA